jgi:pyruvate dehydrogenase E2 component (dihydrolipoamide acetyltransferase)
MAFSVQMPALGESVTEGTVTRWLKQEGDTVEVDEPLLEVSTDKVDTEIPSPAAGVLQKIVAQEDETIEVGAELAVIGDSGGAQSESGGDVEAESGGDVEAKPEDESGGDVEARPESDTESDTDAESGGDVEAEPEPAQASADQESTSDSSGDGTPVTMPALGESVTEGTVTRWLKQVGDSVEVDEPLLEVSTDKVDTEIPSPVAGTVLEITAGEDETVEVGGRLAVVGSGSAPAKQEQPKQEAPQQEAAEQKAPEPKQEEKAPEPPQQEAPKQEAPKQEAPRPAAAPAPERTNGDTPYVTPLVRKLAGEHDVDLSGVRGSGVGGRIRKQDVLAAAEAAKQPEPAPAAAPAAKAAPSAPAADLRGKTEKMSRLRQTVSRRMVESLQTSAQLTQVVEVDVTRIAKLRSRAKSGFEQREGVKLTFLPFFAKASVEALKAHPKLNASINDETKEVTYHGAEHLGIAVDTDRGLLSPAIHNAGDLSVAGLAHKIADLAERTRANKVTPDELFGATFTLTNLGSQGALFDTPIIPQPQVGILGVGLVVKRPVVITDADGNDTIAIRSMAYLALTYDHRLVDGADAGRFLTTIKNRLQEGNFEGDLGL